MTYNKDYYDDEEIISLKSYIEKIKKEIIERQDIVKKSKEELDDLYDSMQSLGSVFKRAEEAVNYSLRIQEKNALKKQIDIKRKNITEQEKDLQKAKELLSITQKELEELIKERMIQ